MKTVNVRNLQKKVAQCVDISQKERVVVTRNGQPAAILIGSDCPGLSARDLGQAFAALQTHDCVLQPSTDGGYVLIGARRFERRALAGTAWSSGRELAQTRRRFARFALRWSELRALADLDTPADYRQARRERLL